VDSQTTIILLGAGLSLVVIASLGDAARRRRPLAWHAYVPWHGLMFAGMTLVVLLAAHLFALQNGTR
jgi:lysylphosphatidylglycerol synthetase-like protein (DUF2156 family)